MDELKNSLWINKFSPPSVSKVIMPKSLKTYFNKLIEKGEIPNLLLFSSSPGTGKSSTAKALIADLKCDTLYINSSLENGIDVIRDTIVNFASCASFSDKKKVIYCEEFDGITGASQKALRGAMDEFSEICRFIVTCNYLGNIIEPIQSRFQKIDFNFTKPEIKEELLPKINKFISAILKHEKVEHSVEIIEKLVNKYYPDIRTMVQVVQQYSDEKGIIDAGVLTYQEISDELVALILDNKFTKAREFIINSNYNYNEIYTFLFKKLIPKLPKEQIPGVNIMLAQYAFQSYFASDKELQMAACIHEIIQIINRK